MKTKPFLLATAGSTVDGRTISDQDIDQMASSYDPKTYGARLNIEHIRGISGMAPFCAYGDVLEVSVGAVDVNFNGKTEKRKALFGVFDVTDNAKALNEAGQKVYPSIEILDNFGGKGFSYLGGVALTDSPAAIATDRLKFNRSLPGSITLSSEEAALLEFEDETGSDSGKFLSSFGAMLDRFAAKFAARSEDKPGAAPADPAANPGAASGPASAPASAPASGPASASALDFTAIRPMFEELGQSFSAEVSAIRSEARSEIDALTLRFKKLEDERETTPAHFHQRRPAANGNAGVDSKYEF